MRVMELADRYRRPIFTFIDTLGAYPGIGAQGIDEGEDGPSISIGELHHAHRLSIALGMRHSKITSHLLADRSALLLSDHRDVMTAKLRKARDDGGVVSEEAISMQLGKILKERLEMIEKIRSIGMAAQLDLLKGLEV